MFLQLPIKVDILKHPSEVDGKSTAIHAGVIAPDDVTIYTYPCIPDYDKDKVPSTKLYSFIKIKVLLFRLAVSVIFSQSL